MYNQYNQRYDILGRFFISGKEYCRVRFLTTKHEKIVTGEAVKSGVFQDDSVVAPKVMKPITQVMNETTKEEIKSSIEALDKVTELTNIEPAPPVQIITGEFKPVGLNFSFEIIATNPHGEDFTVNSEELETFCKENNLDLDVVNAVLEGKQKTHRKWRFVKA